MPQENPASARPTPGTPTDRAAPLSGWAVEQLRRVLRLEEGAGPTAEGRIRREARELAARAQHELSGPPAAPEQIADHLWSTLLRDGRTAAARFFRPYQAGTGGTLWVRRREGGAYPLARGRVEGVLERLCAGTDEPDLEPARLFRHTRSQLRNGMSETELVRALSRTSPGQEAVLRRLCRPAPA